MGMAEFAKAAKDAGADGVLLTDMIVEEAGEYLRVMHENGLAPVFLAAPTSPDRRLKAIAENSQGFIYAHPRELHYRDADGTGKKDAQSLC